MRLFLVQRIKAWEKHVADEEAKFLPYIYKAKARAVLRGEGRRSLCPVAAHLQRLLAFVGMGQDGCLWLLHL